MKKSFRLHLFIRIFLATAIIIIANRQLAQYNLASQIEHRAHQEMARVVADCEPVVSDEQAWRQCANGPLQGDVFSPLIDFFVACPPRTGSQSAESKECQGARGLAMAWDRMTVNGQTVLYGKGEISDEVWHMARREGSSDVSMVMLPDKSLWVYLKKIWALRDRNLIYVLPTIFLMLGVLTAYMVYVVMRPIRLMEETLSTLDFKNIHEKTEIQTPYVEFRKLANVYRDLLKRLDESYENAKRFSSDAAHELRTPLSILRGNVERLIPEVPQGSAIQVYVKNLEDEVDRLILITEKLLMLSRADSNSLSLDLEPVNLSEYLNELIEDDESFYPHIKFVNQIEPGVVWHCDKALIMQLINNVHANALKYNIPKGGWVDIQLQRSGDEVVFTVRNTTTDVPEELPEKAFERFYRSDASRTRRTVDGLGLGLSICREIAIAHRGSMTLQIPATHVVAVEFRAPWTVA